MFLDLSYRLRIWSYRFLSNQSVLSSFFRDKSTGLSSDVEKRWTLAVQTTLIRQILPTNQNGAWGGAERRLCGRKQGSCRSEATRVSDVSIFDDTRCCLMLHKMPSYVAQDAISCCTRCHLMLLKMPSYAINEGDLLLLWLYSCLRKLG